MSIRYIFGGVCIILGYVGGCLYSSKMKSRYATATKLYDGLKIMRIEITNAQKGLIPTLKKAHQATNCDELGKILNALSSTGECNDVIDELDIDSNVRESLKNLLYKVRFSSNDDIKSAFDDCSQTISQWTQASLAAYKKEAVLYKRLGILSGIAVFILLC